jgi:hypothetical protein
LSSNGHQSGQIWKLEELENFSILEMP